MLVDEVTNTEGFMVGEPLFEEIKGRAKCLQYKWEERRIRPWISDVCMGCFEDHFGMYFSSRETEIMARNGRSRKDPLVERRKEV
jgi:hypothetical protein